MSAVLTRDGLGPYVEAITGGRRLRTTSLSPRFFADFAVFGMLLMFVICWTGAYGVQRFKSSAEYAVNAVCRPYIAGFARL